MTGEEFYKWLHSKKEINICEIDFTFDPNDPLAVVLLSIRIVADSEEIIIPYPKTTDDEEQIMTKAVSVILVLNRLMKQYGIDKIFNYLPLTEDGGIFEAEQKTGKIIHNMKKGGIDYGTYNR